MLCFGRFPHRKCLPIGKFCTGWATPAPTRNSAVFHDYDMIHTDAHSADPADFGPLMLAAFHFATLAWWNLVGFVCHRTCFLFFGTSGYCHVSIQPLAEKLNPWVVRFTMSLIDQNFWNRCKSSCSSFY